MPKQPVLQGEPKIIQEGGNVLLEAEVECDPAPTVQWCKDDKPISDGEHYVIQVAKLGNEKFKLTAEIQNFDKPLAGVYKCDIKNDQGQTSATFTVTAGDAPEFLDKPHIVQREGGKVLAIKVKAKSKTEPTVAWTKDDEPVKEDDRVKCVVKKDEKAPLEYTFLLEIKGPIKSDEAKYKCTVKNPEGSNSQSLNLSFD